MIPADPASSSPAGPLSKAKTKGVLRIAAGGHDYDAPEEVLAAALLDLNDAIAERDRKVVDALEWLETVALTGDGEARVRLEDAIAALRGDQDAGGGEAAAATEVAPSRVAEPEPAPSRADGEAPTLPPSVPTGHAILAVDDGWYSWRCGMCGRQNGPLCGRGTAQHALTQHIAEKHYGCNPLTGEGCVFSMEKEAVEHELAEARRERDALIEGVRELVSFFGIVRTRVPDARDDPWGALEDAWAVSRPCAFDDEVPASLRALLARTPEQEDGQ